MRALTITRYGDPDVLKVLELPDPVPAAGELRVRVKRAGLNFAEISARVGLYPDAPKPPFCAGYEVAGVVDALGPGVTGWTVGERVLGMSHFGGHATHAVIKTEQAQRIPAPMSFDEAAALPVNYLTAFHMMFRVGNLQPGQKILIHMAAGGVGLAAIQLCQRVEGVEIFGTASAGKHALLREMGVHHPIDYRTKDYVEEVKALTGGKGVDMVLDALGGADWSKGYSLLRPAGHLLCFGWANMVPGEKRSYLHVAREFLSMRRYAPMTLMDHNRTVSGVNLGHLWGEVEMMSGHLVKLLALAVEGKVKPRVDKVFPLAEGPAAHRYVQARKNVGKVIFDCE
ncbi:MAG: Synaptic vesicle rane protein [Myxococcaceae bacterium]|nr:Synaptic vesicle rane protein [Myxococcaceae bacterium]